MDRFSPKRLAPARIAGAVVGGLLAGGVGTVMGGLSGKTRQTKAITGLALRITVNDAADPVHTIQFLLPGVQCKPGSPYHKEALGHASVWQGRISVLMHQGKSQGDTEDQAGGCGPGDWTLAVRVGSDLESDKQSMEDAESLASPSASAELPAEGTGRPAEEAAPDYGQQERPYSSQYCLWLSFPYGQSP